MFPPYFPVAFELQLEAARRTGRLTELFYRRWRFEQSGQAGLRVSWDKLKQRLLELPAEEFQRKISRLESSVEQDSPAAVRLWRPVSSDVSPSPPA